MTFLDKLGWPVELVEGRPVLNFFRLLIHTRKIVRRWEPPKCQPSDNESTSSGDKDI